MQRGRTPSSDFQKRNPAPRLRVGFLLGRRFTLCAFANFVDVLRLAADEGDRSRPILCDWAVLSHSLDPIPSSCGVMIQPTAPLQAPEEFDYVVVVGGLIDEIPNLPRQSVRFLQAAATAHVPLAGVCTGAFILHRAGLMDGYRCCVSWFHHADFLDQFDGLTPVSDQIFVIDRDRLTCSGGASSAHMAAHLVEKHVGLSAARKSLQIMMIDEALHGDEPQPAIPVGLKAADPAVKKALLHMTQNVAAPLSVEEIALRSLERRFESDINENPGDAYLSMRLAQASLLLVQTDRTIAQIAASTGFCDASHLGRVFKRRQGVTPSQARQLGVRQRTEAEEIVRSKE
jgi:transcriptional regulator GlxA family with amidase domain